MDFRKKQPPFILTHSKGASVGSLPNSLSFDVPNFRHCAAQIIAAAAASALTVNIPARAGFSLE
jgi:hypothetical protein